MYYPLITQIDFCILAFSLTLIIAPFFEKALRLAIVPILLILGILSAGLFFAKTMVASDADNPVDMIYGCSVLLFPGILFLPFIAWAHVRGQGDRWFRFD